MTRVPHNGPALTACIVAVTLAGIVHANPAPRSISSQRTRVAGAQAPGGEDVQHLIRDVVWNEVQSQVNDQSLWRFREAQEESGPRKLLAVFETKFGTIHRLVAINGHPLTQKEFEAENDRIEKILSHPSQLAAEQKKSREDGNEERDLLQMLPEAFLFHEESHHGRVVTIAFVPNPAFHPSTHASEVFHHMVGTIVVDADAKRLVQMDGRLTSKVKFAGGLLGHLDAGGTFHVAERNVGGGHWDVISLDVHMDGKALFFKTISVRQKESYSDYHEVPPTVTLQQAAHALEQDAATPSPASGH